MKARLLLLTLLGTVASATVLLRAAEPDTDTVMTSDHFESVSTDKEMTTNLWGNVDVKGTNLHITCDRLVVVSVRFGDKSQVVSRQNQFKSLIATGRVKIIQGDREANCGRAVVLPNEDKVTLTEKPVVIDHGADATWVGDTLVILRGERRIVGENVKIILPPVKDLGFDKNKALDLRGEVTKPEEKK